MFRNCSHLYYIIPTVTHSLSESLWHHSVSILTVNQKYCTLYSHITSSCFRCMTEYYKLYSAVNPTVYHTVWIYVHSHVGAHMQGSIRLSLNPNMSHLLLVIHHTWSTSTTIHPLPLLPWPAVHLLAVLVFLLLELPEMGLDGGGSLVSLNRAERGHSGQSACPIAGIGVWTRQDTGDSQRGRGNSHVGILCSNDWVQKHNLLLEVNWRRLFFWLMWYRLNLTQDP